MEEEKKEEVHTPGKKRKVSLFKRRRKPNIRPFVQQKKHREYKKTVTRVLIIVFVLFCLAAILFVLQRYFIPNFFLKDQVIVTPQQNIPLTNNEIEKIITESSSDISDVRFSTGSASISFTLRGSVAVYLSPERDIKQQLSLVSAIDRQVITDGKQAISIDLRYNKPIVKY